MTHIVDAGARKPAHSRPVQRRVVFKFIKYRSGSSNKLAFVASWVPYCHYTVCSSNALEKYEGKIGNAVLCPSPYHVQYMLVFAYESQIWHISCISDSTLIVRTAAS